jgi:3-oxoacyl-[acyl-carrier-protein] synthase III
MSLADISLILPHNVNALSWQRLGRRIGFPADRVLLSNVPVTGHAFCADAFINYTTAADRGLLRPGSRYLLAAAGLGATFSAMVVEH